MAPQTPMVSESTAFADRHEAGWYLAAHLDRYRGTSPLVLGIPRGGVPVAAEIARQLDGELDVIVARKVGVPFQPELAMGAVTANGGCYLNTELIAELGIGDDELQAAVEREMAIARDREARFRRGRPPLDARGRTVIVVDDGLATGATMRAAVRSLRRRQPARLIVAVPVGSWEACSDLSAESDEVVCPWKPEPFYAVGQYYRRFSPVADTEVEALLTELHPAPPVPSS